MTPYFIFFTIEFSLILMCSFIKEPQQRKIITIVVIVLMTIFSGFRDLVGFDTESYHNIFKNIDFINFSIDDLLLFEPLFSINMWGIKYIFDDPNIFMLYISVLQGWIAYLICRKQPRGWVFLLIYLSGFYLQNQFNIVRAGIAGLLLVYAFILQKDEKDNTIILISAILFHYSALLFCFFLIKGKRSLNAILFISAAVFSMFFLGGGDRVIEKLSFYFLESDFYSNGSIVFGPYFFVTASLMILVHLMNCRRQGAILHAIFIVVLALKVLQMPFPILWRAYDLFYFFWFALIGYTINKRYTTPKVLAIVALSAVNFWYVTIHSLVYEEEALANRVNRTGEISLFDIGSPLVPYKTFLGR